ncbi:DUF3572 domain-containing protein [Paracoccaceae bacterium GXU_MW_L88]
MKQETAVSFAQDYILWLIQQEDRLAGFMNGTGNSVTELRAGAGDPAFLAGLLDWLLTDEAQILDFAQETQIPPERVLEARAALPGGDVPHWT